ncbi:MAG: glycosyltransferase family 2 protein [Allorhizobium sp.]
MRSPKGLSLGRNVGLGAATGDIIAFPDDDCWYRPALLAEVQALFEAHPERGMLLGRTVDVEGRNSIVPSLPADCDVNRANVIQLANSNTIFVRREIAAVTGPFDEKLGVGSASMFQGAEDRDYVARAMEAGANVHFVHDLTVFHDQIDAGQTSHLGRIRKYSLGDGAFYRKHRYGFGTITLLTIRAIGGIPLRLLRGEAPQLAFKLTYCYYLISGYLHWTGEI